MQIIDHGDEIEVIHKGAHFGRALLQDDGTWRAELTEVHWIRSKSRVATYTDKDELISDLSWFQRLPGNPCHWLEAKIQRYPQSLPIALPRTTYRKLQEARDFTGRAIQEIVREAIHKHLEQLLTV